MLKKSEAKRILKALGMVENRINLVIKEEYKSELELLRGAVRIISNHDRQTHKLLGIEKRKATVANRSKMEIQVENLRLHDDVERYKRMYETAFNYIHSEVIKLTDFNKSPILNMLNRLAKKAA